jgi:hypothetical protein
LGDWGVSLGGTARLKGEMALYDLIVVKNSKAQLFVFNNVGHFMSREHSEEFNAMLVTWINYWKNNPVQPPVDIFQLPSVCMYC